MGVEGPTEDLEINDQRARQRRNLLATIFLSQGIPMLLGGDELGRTQGGNNNGYCQDNEISWFDWEHTDVELLAFTQRLISFRRAHPVFRRRHFFHGEPVSKDALPDIAWFRPDGKDMEAGDWHGDSKAIGVFLNGQAIPSPDRRGERVEDDSFVVLLNAHHEDAAFTLPKRLGERWLRVIDSADAFEEGQTAEAGKKTAVAARSLAVFRRTG
jgi:glycogen operon protein